MQHNVDFEILLRSFNTLVHVSAVWFPYIKSLTSGVLVESDGPTEVLVLDAATCWTSGSVVDVTLGSPEVTEWQSLTSSFQKKNNVHAFFFKKMLHTQKLINIFITREIIAKKPVTQSYLLTRNQVFFLHPQGKIPILCHRHSKAKYTHNNNINSMINFVSTPILLKSFL